MIRCILACSLAVTLGTAGAAQAAELYSAILEGAQEVPPVTTDASGTATLLLNDAETELAMTIQLFGLDLDGNQTADPNDDVIGMHIHAAPAGVNGGVVFGLISPNNTPDDLLIDPVAGTVNAIWDAGEGNGTTLTDQLAALRSAGLYLNVHTPVNQGGEIRGQIVPEPAALAMLAMASMAVILRRRRAA